MKRRVLQLIPSFQQGGSERQAVNLTRLLIQDATFDVYAATLNNDGPLKAQMDELLSDIPVFPLTSFYNANFVAKARACARYMRSHKIDVIHTHDFYTNVFGITAAVLAGLRVKVASKRETGGLRSPTQELVERIAFGRSDAIVVNSDAVADHVSQHYVAADKIRKIYNGIDMSAFPHLNGNAHAVRRQLSVPPDVGVRLITLVANLRHQVKNVPLFLHAAKRVLRREENVHFVVSGEGELKPELEGLAQILGIAEHITFTGRCDQVPALLAASYACVLTSSAEGFSNSILEYMAAGKPVVATDVGGAREAVIEGQTGYLVPPGDDDALASKLIKLLNDQEKARKFGRAGYERVRKDFSEQAQVRKTVDLYNDLFASK